jgi:hypothetical protein
MITDSLRRPKRIWMRMMIRPTYQRPIAPSIHTPKTTFPLHLTEITVLEIALKITVLEIALKITVLEIALKITVLEVEAVRLIIIMTSVVNPPLYPHRYLPAFLLPQIN